MYNKIKSFGGFYNLDIFLFFIFIVSLPISHVAAIQNIFFFIFAFLILLRMQKENFCKIKNLNYFYILIFSFFLLALISVNYSLFPFEVLDQIRSELIKPFFVMFIMFLFILNSPTQKVRLIIKILFFSLFIHTIINLFYWHLGGYWPFRAGGLLDSGGGERFGIWATYALAASISLFFTKYKKVAVVFLLLAMVSIVANNTRATFLGAIFVFLSFFIFIYSKNKLSKKIIVLFVCFLIVLGGFYSKKFPQRYNFYNMTNSINLVIENDPKDFLKIASKNNLDASAMMRLSMWKSVILHRVDNPIILHGYGRFLFGKEIVKIWENKKENIPCKVFSQAHSDFVTILFSLGLFGLVLFILILVYNLYIALKMFKISKYKVFSSFVFLGTIGFILSMMFGSFFGDSEQIYFYILYGILLALYLIEKDKIKNEKNKIY